MKSSSDGVGPVQVLEDEERRVDVGHPLEEQPPRGEEILRGRGASARETEEVGEARLDQPALVGVGDVLLERRVSFASAELGPRPPGSGPHPHHLGQRPVRDALAVGQAPAAVPVDDVGEAVDVLVELPRQARLADPGDAR